MSNPPPATSKSLICPSHNQDTDATIQDEKIKKILVILNGNAGKGHDMPVFIRRLLRLPKKETMSLEETHDRIIAALKKSDIHPKIVRTQWARHATELTKEAVNNGYDVVVAVGGDGTINEIVNGLVNTKTRLGIIPRGTANLLATEMGIPSNLEEACAVIAKNNLVHIDTATVNDHYFTIMAGIGFDAHVVKKVDASKVKSKWGALAYPLIAIRELVRYPFRKIKIRTQDGVDHIAFYVFVQNAKIYASGFKMTPHSKKDDGVLEVLMFPTKNIFSLILYLLSRNKQKYHLEIQGVKSLEINSSHAIQIDGDYICKGPAKIKIVPQSLYVLVT